MPEGRDAPVTAAGRAPAHPTGGTAGAAAARTCAQSHVARKGRAHGPHRAAGLLPAGTGPCSGSCPRPPGRACPALTGRPVLPDCSRGDSGARLRRRLGGGALQTFAIVSAGRGGDGAGGAPGRCRRSPPARPRRPPAFPRPGSSATPAAGWRPGHSRLLLRAHFSPGRPPASASSSFSSSVRRATRRPAAESGWPGRGGRRLRSRRKGCPGAGAELPAAVRCASGPCGRRRTDAVPAPQLGPTRRWIGGFL